MDVPIGTIILWQNSNIPTGWAICDGTNGTPVLVDRFALGATTDSDLLKTGGTATHSHSNSNTGTRSAHKHNEQNVASGVTRSTLDVSNGGNLTPARVGHTHNVNIKYSNAGSHNHTVGNTDTVNHLPPHIKMYYIMKIT